MQAERIERAKELLKTVRHAAMATVNADGSPHNTPYRFMCSLDLTKLYWGSHPESEHSKNVARSGQVFVVLFEANEGGGLYIQASGAHIAEGDELDEALGVHNALRAGEGKQPLPLEYYQGDSPQRMYVATTEKFWANASKHGSDGRITRDIRFEVNCTDLLT